ncbi:MAG TPA: Ig domain-containing protein, partial [Acidimicrobiales bacterium]|nr:Ig domain-containing protein [Acidimicrobiales bacterium]
MNVRRASTAAAVCVVALVCVVATLAFTGTAHAGIGPGASGNTIPGAAAAQSPFTSGTFDSAQPIDVVVPANSILTPGATIFILECAAPNGVNPSNTSSCDGNTGYDGGTISVNGDGSIDVTGGSSASAQPYKVFALPDHVSLGESPAGTPKCGQGAANECVLYIGQGGGGDPGMSQPHFFSQAFQVHTDPTDSGTLNPGDGTFPADSAPAITSANSTSFSQGSAGTFMVTASGYPAPTFSETGALPAGVTLNATTGVLSGTTSVFGTYPITLTASNGISPNATQSFTLTVQPGISGDTIPHGAQAQSPFTPGTFDSGQPIDVVVPANGVLTPGHQLFVLECAAPKGVDPTNTSSCDGNTAYDGGTITVNGDGSVDITGGSSASAQPYKVFALPDHVSLGESPAGTPKCGQGAANECVLYIGQGGGGDPGMSQPHFFSQAFQVHPDATDSGTLNPGDGTFPADSAPAITSVNHATFTKGSAGSFTVTATGYGPPTLSETGTLPAGVTLNATTGVLSGTPTVYGTYPVTLTAANGVAPNATQGFTLTVQPGTSGDTITNAAEAQSPFTPGTFDSGQPIDVVVPANGVLTPGHQLFVLECAAPKGVDPTNTSSCDGNTAYDGVTITVNGDGSVDITGGSSASAQPYKVFALPDHVSLGESPAGAPKCGQGSPYECVLYIGQGGGGDPGMSQPHFFSQAFQVHP